MKIFTVHSVAVDYDEEDVMDYFLTFEDAYEFARGEIREWERGKHEAPILTMEEACEKFYAPRPNRMCPMGYVKLDDGISIGWVQVEGNLDDSITYNVDDGVFERIPVCDAEICDEPADVCATCELRNSCGNAK